ncbi:MAG: pilus assembly protein CpaD [Caulobacteraceae bacterium]|nr:pilus assembly protein CpaD [Caulobacteraceae bacterium]
MSRTISPRRGAEFLLGVLGMAVALVGCASAPNEPVGPGRTTEMPNAIEVSVSHRTLAVHFDPGEVAPRPKDLEALNVLLATGDVARGDTVRIERAPGVIADGRARALAIALARQGLRPTLAAPGAAPDGELRLVVEHATATVPRCPNWTKPPGNDLENTMHSDFGCASALDLAAMVADPRDLIEGRPLAPVVGDPAIWPINRYRIGAKSEATSLQPMPGATTTGATALVTAQPQQSGGDRPPSGGTAGAGGGPPAAGAPGGYSNPPQAPQ